MRTYSRSFKYVSDFGFSNTINPLLICQERIFILAIILLLVSCLESHGGINSIMSITSNGAEGQAVLLCEWSGEDVRTSSSDSGSGSNIPPVMLLPINAGPAYVRRKNVRR